MSLSASTGGGAVASTAAATMSSSSSSAPPPPKRPRLNTDVSRVTFPPSSSMAARPQKNRKKLPPIAKQTIHPGTAEVLGEDVVAEMLGQACALVVRSFGFDGATDTAMEEMRRHAETFFQMMIHECMTFARSQRRSRPTIQDCTHFLERIDITAGDCEAEIDRYRRATSTTTITATTPGSSSNSSTSHVFNIPEPPPTPPPEPDLRLLLGSELFPKPSGKVKRKNAEPKRDYAEDFFPSLPSKHTYATTAVFVERPSDPREIRERATTEARLAGVTLRKLLANFSKSTSGSKKALDSKKLRDERAMALATGRGDSRRRARDAAWQAAFDELDQAAKKKKASQEENGTTPETLMGDDIMLDLDEEREGGGKEKESEAERRWWMDGIVNAEKEYFRKGTMTRVLKTPIVLV